MKNLSFILRNLSRNKKLTVIVFADLCTAFLCWVIFGPPLTFLIATNFATNLNVIIFQNILSFVIPVLFLFIYFILSGFYRSLMKFFDSKDSIFRALIGSFIFGFSWGFVYILQYDIIKTDFLTTVLLQSLLLSSVFYAFLQISRDIARLIIYPSRESLDGKPVLIYGAGDAGNELYQSIKQNSKIRVVGFYDNSFTLKGASINNIKIYGKEKNIKKLSEKYKDLEIYLAIPSLDISERRKIISSLEKYKVAVRSMPALHEVIADEKKMAEIQDLSIDDILPSDQTPPMELAELAERTASAWKLLDKANLTEKERKIVSLRFGLDGSNEWRTLAEVARHMSCSREYCRQVVQRALRKLRKAGIQNGLVDSIS